MADTNINAILTSANISVNVAQTTVNATITPVEVTTNIQHGANISTTLSELNVTASMVSGGRGKSAYESWLEEGHTGTESDFLQWLQGDSSYTFTKISASATWMINHGLNKYPSVTVVDSGENVVIGEVRYIDENNLIVSFSAEFSGKAYLN